MTLKMPPSFEDLRALVRGALDRDDRTALSSWLVLHADEYVAQGLDALSVEWAHLQRDEHLPSVARRISETFWLAFEAGQADIDPEVDRDGRPAIDVMRIPETGDPFGDAAPPVFEVRVVDSAMRRVRIMCPGARSVVASNDLGDLRELLPIDDYECTLQGGRVTFWVFLNPTGAVREHFVEVVRAAVEAQAVRAIRVTDTFFEPV